MGEKGEKKKVEETKVLGRVAKEFEALEPEERERIVRYLVQRFGLRTEGS